MNVAQLKAFCRRFPGAGETLYKAPYNFLVYTVGQRKFAYFKTSAPERWRFSVRVSPDRFLELTDVPGVKPARYRGRYHWITIVDVARFPAPYLTELVNASYDRALASQSRAAQRAIRRSPRPTEQLRAELLRLPDVREAPSRFGAHRAAWFVAGREFAHLHADDLLDLRLPRAVQATLRDDPKAHFRAAASEWLELEFNSADDVAHLAALARLAWAAARD